MQHPFNLLFGLVSFGFGTAQLLAGVGVIDTSGPLFLSSHGKGYRIAIAVWAFVLGTVAVVSAFL